eukprot:TRINITY_DN22258_c0_g1_i1.p1 TRINITY_DN22258_c0_g1~~TRINITY_DN22258_c0_g1_i1.p1  ORF type:complete len:115 (-),score=8.55 TRINITY_DN22258_c0_g1_i1:83-427(-)
MFWEKRLGARICKTPFPLKPKHATMLQASGRLTLVDAKAPSQATNKKAQTCNHVSGFRQISLGSLPRRPLLKPHAENLLSQQLEETLNFPQRHIQLHLEHAPTSPDLLTSALAE